MDASIFDCIGAIISIRKSSVTADRKQQCSCRNLDMNKRLGAHLNTFQIEVKRKRYGEKKMQLSILFF